MLQDPTAKSKWDYTVLVQCWYDSCTTSFQSGRSARQKVWPRESLDNTGHPKTLQMMIESLCDIGVVTESIFGVELGKGLGLGLLSARVRWNEKARDVDVMAPRQREALRKLHTLSHSSTSWLHKYLSLHQQSSRGTCRLNTPDYRTIVSLNARTRSTDGQ